MELKTILLVDDEDDIRAIGEMALQGVGGWDVVLAASGSEALDRAREHQPDIILLDVMMPGMDGMTTLRRLRDDEASKAIPVVFITARAQHQEVADYFALGAAGVIVKPFDPIELPDEIRAIASGL